MRRPRHAFTLLELLTVIAIMGLLVGILLPSLSSARQSAKANVCISNLKGIGTSFSLYLTDNSDTFPPHRLETLRPAKVEDEPKPFVNDLGRRAPTWQFFLPMDTPVMDTGQYSWAIGQFGFFDENTPGRPSGVAGTRASNPVFGCPALDDPDYELDIRNGAFGYNYQYLGNARNDKVKTRWDNFPVQMHRIKSVSATIVAADSRGAGHPHGRHSYTLDPPRLAVEVDAVRFGPNPSVYTEKLLEEGDLAAGLDPAVFAYSPAEARHKGRVNAVFVDGHGEVQSLLELGYQLSDGTTPAGVPKNVPVPILDPKTGTYTAHNRKWNGQGQDPLADEHKPGP